MQASLTTAERQIGIGLAVTLALGGLVMAAAARHGVMAVHGAMALALGLGLVFRLGGALYDVAPAGLDRASRYDDGPTRFGIWMTPPDNIRLRMESCEDLLSSASGRTFHGK